MKAFWKNLCLLVACPMLLSVRAIDENLAGIYPELQEISPYLNDIQLTPKLASDRVFALTKKIKALKKKLTRRLNTVREFISYHRMPKSERESVISSWDTNTDAHDPSYIMSSRSKTLNRSTPRGDLFERELMDENIQAIVDRVAHITAQLDQAKDIDTNSPLLHTFGTIDKAEQTFDTLHAPKPEAKEPSPESHAAGNSTARVPP